MYGRFGEGKMGMCGCGCVCLSILCVLPYRVRGVGGVTRVVCVG